ncbi:xanthine dehydrogenase family protein molybdopterin-binding subunit [uncultured Roseobacter sp.]|uniref:xanthine dehydrogenase family protein molybdopterin-binding subunit n=1 Tax=uncultured Roseobacter sp. TaxID=114847 RepID=UPI002618CA96|nr:xanthine dehydrogenase family protein molybdopterin-binding subunit [uncultured Roseobacter sp.]
MNLESKVIGKPVSRVDGRLKTTGAARYAADHRPVEGRPLHAVLVKSSIASGRITGFDLSALQSMSGFVRFVSHLDGALIRTIKNPTDGAFATGEEYTPFENDRVHFVGQHIGLVVAQTLEVAEAAAKAVVVNYETSAARIEFADPSAEVRQPDLYNTGEELQVSRGHVEAGLVEAVEIVKATYTTPIEHHNPIEPSATLAVWDGDHVTIYDATQGSVNDKNYVAFGMSVDPKNVRILNPFIGGGFGCKGFTWPHTLIAAAAARAVEQPVLLVLSRKDMYTSCGHRPYTEQEVTLAADADGVLTATRHRTQSYRSLVGDHVEPCGMTTAMLYQCDNLEVTHSVRVLNRPSGTPLRSPGEAPGTFALESAMDELAEKLGMDSVELRRRNHTDIDQRNGRKWSSKHLLQCYDLGAEKIDWAHRKAPGAWRDGNDFVGLGMATACYPGYRMPTQTRLKLDRDGTLHVAVAVQDIGTGLYTVLAQMVADRFGTSPERIRVLIGDSDLPPGPLAGGSMTTASVAAAVDDGCRALSEKLRARLVDMGHTPGNEPLVIDGGALQSGPLSVPAAEVMPTDAHEIVAEGGSDDTYGFTGGVETDKSFYSFGAIFAEVRIDRDFGIIRVPKMTGVFDVGRVINAKTARSQMLGGMTFGIGMALMEETFIDDKTGRFVNSSLGEYYVPVNADVNEFDVEMLDIPDYDFNPFGARGLGEISNVGASAAIANAVYNATGIRVRHLPIRLDDLLEDLPR